ncbi:MAG: adenosylmethionine decarboxylase [Nitrososphaeria archaeon]|nr:adenosylmethionine decarboxylase [Nitrososphaeria archaeon]MDW8021936.1 adenosylmethionine decarboxylase [Nitrososphaerota archaeon]
MKVLGRHIIAELHGCDPGLLTNLDKGVEALREAVRVSGATYLGEFHKVFEPWGGFTAIIALAESHISIHTWPEYGYAALDIFTCGESADPWKAYEYIVEVYRPERINVIEVKRGLVSVEECEVRQQ